MVLLRFPVLALHLVTLLLTGSIGRRVLQGYPHFAIPVFLLGPVSIQVLFILIKRPIEPLFEWKFYTGRMFFLFLFIGYLIGWIEVGVFKIFQSLFRFIGTERVKRIKKNLQSRQWKKEHIII